MSDGPLKHPGIEQVLAIHRAVLERFGGSDGLRDRGMLESALAAPQATSGGTPIFTDPVEIAAAYLFYLCSNHPFVDGNKRVALATCLVFLNTNGFRVTRDSPEWETFVLEVAASKRDRPATTARLRELLEGSSESGR